MTDWSALVAIEAAWLAALILPGPDFLTVSHTAVTRSRRAGLAAAGGVGLGTAVWAVASLVGLGALLASAHWLYQAVKLVGAAYLVVVGIGMLRDARRPPRPEHDPEADLPAYAGRPVAEPPTAAQDPSDHPQLRRARWHGGFLAGLRVNLSNPKAAVFFTSLFAVAAPPGAPLWFQTLLVGTLAASAVGWYVVVALAFALQPARRAYHRARRAVTAAVGALLVGLGTRLAVQD